MKISLCMIVKNEEEVLSRCLESIKEAVDEIVIVDTGSTDQTAEIAKTYTDKVYYREWTDDFSAARNSAFSFATGDYLMWLDADDYISPENRERFSKLRERLEEELPDMVMCPYDTAFEGTVSLSSFYRERLVRREAGFLWKGRVHECMIPRGKILYSEFRVFHLGSEKVRGARNLHIYQKWAAEEPLSARDKFYYGRELYYNRLYTEAIAVLSEMLEGQGWYVNQIEACRILARCYTEKKDRDQALSALFRSFLYGEPRAAVLCEIAEIFKTENRLQEAIFWYESALKSRDHSKEGDFEEPEKRSIVPLLELTYCYYAIGEKQKAFRCHKKAEEIHPDHPSVVYNRTFFENCDSERES